MWYLVLYIIGQGSTVAIIPEKYPTEEACHAAAKPDRWEHSCIPAPIQAINDSGPVIKDLNGRICYSVGNNSYTCTGKIDMPKCVTNINSGKLECN